MLKPGLRILKLISINVVVFIVLVESMSVAFYFFKTGELFYKRNRTRLSATRSEFEIGASRGGVNLAAAYQLHPYFGFVSTGGFDERAYPNSPFAARANNVGFLCPYDFPFKKANKNQFVIGIF